jgi:hypothetical protein
MKGVPLEATLTFCFFSSVHVLITPAGGTKMGRDSYRHHFTLRQNIKSEILNYISLIDSFSWIQTHVIFL